MNYFPFVFNCCFCSSSRSNISRSRFCPKPVRWAQVSGDWGSGYKLRGHDWLPRDKQTNQKIIRMSKNTTAQTLPLKQTFLQLQLYFNVGTKVPLKSAKVFFVQIQTFWMCSWQVYAWHNTTIKCIQRTRCLERCSRFHIKHSSKCLLVNRRKIHLEHWSLQNSQKT